MKTILIGILILVLASNVSAIVIQSPLAPVDSEDDVVNPSIYADSASVNTSTNEGPVDILIRPLGSNEVICPYCGHYFVVGH